MKEQYSIFINRIPRIQVLSSINSTQSTEYKLLRQTKIDVKLFDTLTREIIFSKYQAAGMHNIAFECFKMFQKKKKKKKKKLKLQQYTNKPTRYTY